VGAEAFQQALNPIEIESERQTKRWSGDDDGE
jgi:hypothetical protein